MHVPSVMFPVKYTLALDHLSSIPRRTRQYLKHILHCIYINKSARSHFSYGWTKIQCIEGVQHISSCYTYTPCVTLAQWGCCTLLMIYDHDTIVCFSIHCSLDILSHWLCQWYCDLDLIDSSNIDSVLFNAVKLLQLDLITHSDPPQVTINSTHTPFIIISPTYLICLWQEQNRTN